MTGVVPPMHQRTLIRHAIVRLLKAAEGLGPIFGERIHPDRVAPWLEDELPACGVYVLHEATLESDVSPDPHERSLEVAVELLAQASGQLDDALDAYALAVEQTVSADAVGRHMGAILDEWLVGAGHQPLPLTREGLHPADSLLLVKLQKTEVALAEDGSRTLGVATMSYRVDYALPPHARDLPDFLLALTGWSMTRHGDISEQKPIDAVDRIDFPGTSPILPKFPDVPLGTRLDDHITTHFSKEAP